MVQPFAAVLRDYRLAAGLSQEELAERCRLSVDTISALERGRRKKPYRNTTDVLADALGLCDEDRTRLKEAASGSRASMRDLASRPRRSEGTPNNLPTHFSRFVDRDEDLSKIQSVVIAHRLVTLVGAGGIGKTRVAVKVARNLLEHSCDSAWFVDLTSTTDGCFVPNAVASALSVGESASRPLLETLVEHLRDKRCLLIFDTCEHLLQSIVDMVETILRSCPRVRILATSREPLAMSGEQTYRLRSLGVPTAEEDEKLSVEDALKYGAIALFVDRASSANNGFTLSEALVPVVAQICRRLDGIALAIELAAARMNVFSAMALMEKLEERFLSLTGGNRTALSRHRTMRASLDWSYAMLTLREQSFLRLLSVFNGGFSLDLASQLHALLNNCEEEDTLDLLASLVDKSLLQSDTSTDTTRYRLLESMRRYLREKLHEHGELKRASRAHAMVFLALAERLDSEATLISDRVWATQVRPEIENWRAALDWEFSDDGDVRTAQRLAAALSEVWHGLSPLEGRRWVLRGLDACDDDTPLQVRARLELAEAHLGAWLLMYSAAVPAALRALERYEALGDSRGMGEALLRAGQSLIFSGNVREGESRLCEALVLARSGGPQLLLARVTHVLGLARAIETDYDVARNLLREALTIYGAGGAQRYAGNVALNLAEIEFHAGDAEAAVLRGREAIDIVLATNNRVSRARVLGNCAAYLVALNRFEEAERYACEALAVARESRSEVLIALMLQHLAAVAALRESEGYYAPSLHLAARLLGFIDARLTKLEALREYTEQQEYDRVLSLLRKRLGPELGNFIEEGRRWSEEQASTEALLR